MTTPPDNIARNIAERFAPELGARLPAAVADALAHAYDDEVSYRSVDTTQMLAFASFVVSLASLAWTVNMGLWQQRLASGDTEKLKQENAILRGMLAARLNEEAPRPAQIEESLRLRLVETAADEAIAEATQREGRP